MINSDGKYSGIELAKEFFAQKANGGDKTIEDYFGIWKDIRETLGNVDDVPDPKNAIVASMMFQPSVVMRQRNVYFSVRHFGRTVNEFTFVAQTNTSSVLQMKVAQALSAKPTKEHFGWIAPQGVKGWEDLYWEVLQAYKRWILLKCSTDPTTMKAFLALQYQDMPENLRNEKDGWTEIILD